ncbi:MAG: type II secretion system protein [Armatimonadetes bacterium]|nr:type II secretion system protein [Armatimonadota bacterium]
MDQAGLVERDQVVGSEGHHHVHAALLQPCDHAIHGHALGARAGDRAGQGLAQRAELGGGEDEGFGGGCALTADGRLVGRRRGPVAGGEGEGAEQQGHKLHGTSERDIRRAEGSPDEVRHLGQIPALAARKGRPGGASRLTGSRPVHRLCGGCSAPLENSVPTRCARRAFTLIELLVVMAIISLLAAQLFPVYAKAREKAETISCVANQKQLSFAALEYSMDYDERWFVFNQAEVVWGSGRGWSEALYPYMKNRQILVCPGGPDDDTEVQYLSNDALTAGAYFMIDQPSSTITLYDGATTIKDSDPGDFEYARDFGRDQCGPLGMTSFPGGYAFLKPRHNEGWNVAYADGHVKWTKSCGEGNTTGPTRQIQ